MQKRALNIALTSVTGTCLAGMLVAGVAVASGDDSAQQNKAPSQTPIAQQDSTKRTEARNPAEAGKPGEKPAEASARKKSGKEPILTGTTTASYFWDDGSGIRGDTGAPASGKPMQKGMFASPSWPMNTKVKVSANGRSTTGFVGDRGPGEPSHRGIMLDLDTYTFRYLLDGEKPESKYVSGTGQGHIEGLKYEVLEWGDGPGERGQPEPFGN